MRWCSTSELADRVNQTVGIPWVPHLQTSDGRHDRRRLEAENPELIISGHADSKVDTFTIAAITTADVLLASHCDLQVHNKRFCIELSPSTPTNPDKSSPNLNVTGKSCSRAAQSLTNERGSSKQRPGTVNPGGDRRRWSTAYSVRGRDAV